MKCDVCNKEKDTLDFEWLFTCKECKDKKLRNVEKDKKDLQGG